MAAGRALGAEAQVNPNRPTRAITAESVPAGMAQIEVGMPYQRDASGDRPVRRLAPNALLRFGLFENLEASAGTFFLRERSEGQGTSGLGDTTLAAKWHFLDDEAWRPALAVQPFVKLPTASRGKSLGSGRADFGATLAAGKGLPGNLTILPNLTLVGVSQSDGSSGLFLQRVVAFPIFWGVTDRLTAFWEIFYQSRDRPAGRHGVGTDFGLALLLHRRVMADVAGEFRLAGATPDWVVRGGLSVLLGPVLGEGPGRPVPPSGRP